jgi:hypothetical protein
VIYKYDEILSGDENTPLQVDYKALDHATTDANEKKLIANKANSLAYSHLVSSMDIPVRTAIAQVFSSHGQPLVCADFNISKYPLLAAVRQVSLSHGQPFVRAHFSTFKRPALAALMQVSSSHGQSFSCAHCNTSKCPL